MNEHTDHTKLVQGFLKEQGDVFASSAQGIYAFLDDDARVCNQKFATLLGYESADEWASVDVKGSFPDTFVDGKSQTALVSAYQDAMENMAGSTFQVTWKKKTGGTVDSTVILVSVEYQGHVFALHFVTKAE